MIYDITASFPADEKFGLTSQMGRVAVSIPANIAEGFERKSRRELINSLYISSGSISELDTHLEISNREDYPIDDAVKNSLKTDREMLIGVISSLKGPKK
jgi:four helix bundle protein|tara:strand:+ start:123 stop:422 length:300 start_codon:yes stop_codon:yes gene_type:complete